MVEFRSKLDSSKSTALVNRTFKKTLWLFVILSVIMIVFGAVGGLIAPEDEADLYVGVGMVVFGVLLTPLGYLLTRFLQSRNDKASSFISPDTEEIYTFDQDYITIVQTRGDEYFSTAKARYSYFYKVFEDKNYYYLYISKMQSHVIDKSSLTQGTLEELNELLRIHLGNNFKTK